MLLLSFKAENKIYQNFLGEGWFAKISPKPPECECPAETCCVSAHFGRFSPPLGLSIREGGEGQLLPALPRGAVPHSRSL